MGKNKRKGDVYRKAAKFLEDGTHCNIIGGFSCLAITKAARPEYTGNAPYDGFSYTDLAETQKYEEVYPELLKFMDRDHRILALCMMAEFVEAEEEEKSARMTARLAAIQPKLSAVRGLTLRRSYERFDPETSRSALGRHRRYWNGCRPETQLELKISNEVVIRRGNAYHN